MRAKLQVGINLKPTIDKKQRAAERALGVKELDKVKLVFTAEENMYSI